MIGRIVEVADDRRHLFMHRGFMVVQDSEGERKELGQVPLDGGCPEFCVNGGMDFRASAFSPRTES